MPNLKGGTHPKQKNDVKIRLDARGVQRTGEARFDGLAHSTATLAKRMWLLDAFIRFIEKEGIEGKLNNVMTPEIITHFFKEYGKELSLSSIENYISNFSALVKGLRLKNITIPEKTDYEFFQRLKDELGRPDPRVFETGRYMDKKIVQSMHEKLPHRSRVVALLQYKLCFRASEALMIANAPDKYLENLTQLSHIKPSSFLV
jgi:hypothetical protein